MHRRVGWFGITLLVLTYAFLFIDFALFLAINIVATILLVLYADCKHDIIFVLVNYSAYLFS